MAGPAAKYAHDDSDEADKPLKVCAEAGRKCVRNIHQYPVLSVEWIALVDSLKQLTRLVQLEGRMPNNAKVGECQGRNADSDGTLWDQEAHENAIRILVEEAKVNLCLRMMNDYKAWQYNLELRQNTFLGAVQALDYNESQLEQKCNQFEESLGLLLWRAFMHVETLQLMDIPLLIEHISLVLRAALPQTPGAEVQPRSAKSQETIVLYYFSSLMKHAEKLNNGELLMKSKEHRLVNLAVELVLGRVHEYPAEVNTAAAEGFAALADNEDFRTCWEDFFINPSDGMPDLAFKATFLELEAKLVTPIVEADPSRKRDLRPLLDFFRTIQRTMPK